MLLSNELQKMNTGVTITDDKQIDICLEQICEQGCRSVNQTIQQLEQGKAAEIVRCLTASQRGILLNELKSIMAVYAETGSCELFLDNDFKNLQELHSP